MLRKMQALTVSVNERQQSPKTERDSDHSRQVLLLAVLDAPQRELVRKLLEPARKLLEPADAGLLLRGV